MSQHVPESAPVVERRLRPIYDNLEVGNNRKALQESEKLLKKHPNLLCARALKGLALLRLGRYEESHSFLQAVAEAKPVDDSTLQVLSFCYKEMEQLDKIVDLYNHAVKQSPGNEELLAHLFISHVRLEDFKSQQSVALQLYKAQPKNAYYFWAVMSVVLQGIRGPESKIPDKKKIYLALAQRMVDKLLKENKLESEQELYLYLHILNLQAKYEEALNFLNSEIFCNMCPSAPIIYKMDLLKKLKKWQDIYMLSKELLLKDPDRWDYYEHYLNSCFELLNCQQIYEMEKIEQEKQKTAIQILDDCHDFFCQLIETPNLKKVRGPYLARIELFERMHGLNLNAYELLGDFSELIIEYFRLFGDKSCCTNDIAMFLPTISIEEREELAKKLLLESGITSTILPQNRQQMQRHICALQISRMCGSHTNLKTEHLLAFYTALKLHYEHGLSSFGKKVLSTDMGPSDAYALLAANVMYDISLREKKSDYLFEALCLLQYVLRNSTSNFHVKLLSLKIYHTFGCLLGAQEMYDYLDIKQIQLDSMGYIHCNLLPLCGRFSMGRSVFDSTLKFFTNSYKERLEYVALTYRFCTFSKLEEFMNFKERLTNSIHYIAISVEAQLCDIVVFYGTVHQNLAAYTAMCIEPAEDRISWNELSDNRDLSAIINWDPLHLVNSSDSRKKSFDQEVEVLQIRSLMLRLIASFIDLYHNGQNSKILKGSGNTSLFCEKKPNNQIETVESLLQSWIGTFRRIRQSNHKPMSNRFLSNILPTRLHLLLELPYEKFFEDLAQLVIQFNVGGNELPIQCKVVCDNVQNIVDVFANIIKQSGDASEDGLWQRREWQNKIAGCLEILSLYAFILSVIHEKLQTTTKIKKKKNLDPNLHEHNVSDKERCILIIQLMQNLRRKLLFCETTIQIWKTPNLPRDLNTILSDMSLKPEDEATLIGDVISIFKESHELMVTEIKNLIKDKKRMVTK